MNKTFKQKALLILPYLAPYRIDVLNGIGEQYNLTVAFFYENAPEQNFNQEELRRLLNVKYIFLKRGIHIRERSIKFGIYWLIKKIQPDIVFINEYNQVSIILALYKKLKIFNYALIATTSDNVYIAEQSKWFRRFPRKFVLSECKGIVVYGKNVADWYINHFPNMKVTICSNIENPVRLLANKPIVSLLSKKVIDKYMLHGKRIFLFVGRLHEVKNIDLLINAYDELYGKSKNHVLFIIGDGPLKKELQEDIDKREIADKILILNRMDSLELYSFYNIADIFILPSKHEPFGAVVNEALIWGCPCIVSDKVGATDYILEGWNGTIFESGNKQSLIDALKRSESLNHSKTSLMNKTFEEYIQAYVEIIKNN